MRLEEGKMKLTKEQKKTISRVVNRHIRKTMNRKIRKIKESMCILKLKLEHKQ